MKVKLLHHVDVIPARRARKLRADITGMLDVFPHASLEQVVDYVMREDAPDVEYLLHYRRPKHDARNIRVTICFVGIRNAP